MRLSGSYILFTAVSILIIMLMFANTAYRQKKALPLMKERAGLVSDLMLTDLCLFTEARYTRHPSMADRFAPFQDHPGALEHFPSGSLTSPPSKGKHAK